jgi:hypothetical protein
VGIREAIERNRGATIGVVVLMLVAAAFFVFYNDSSDAESPLTRSFYTIDEGKTWFVDTAERIPPFDHEGQTAYRVRLFTTDGGRTQFAGYVERFTPEARRRIEAAQRGGEGEPKGRPILSIIDELLISGTEVKKPGPNHPWVRRDDPRAGREVLDVKGPNGEPAVQVMP